MDMNFTYFRLLQSSPIQQLKQTQFMRQWKPLEEFEEFIFSLFLASSGSAGYHYKNKTYTPDEVDLAVPATLVDEQSQVTDAVRCAEQFHSFIHSFVCFITMEPRYNEPL